MFSKSVFPFLGVVIGGVVGGIGGAIAGFFIAAVLHGIIRGLFMRAAINENKSDLDTLVSKAESDPEIAAKIHQLAALKRMENVHSLYESGQAMSSLPADEQQAYVIMLDFMQKNSAASGELDQFNEFLNMVKTIHFKGNSILGSYLRQVS
ncbi:hypothetical protein [Vibrio sp. 10N.261.54.A5]|uniref:hypothetical protein n=1 Tax=Vibrio sp. 10N.261.54.A5 TaxID=3229686 RepID=UPI00354CB8CB